MGSVTTDFIDSGWNEVEDKLDWNKIDLSQIDWSKAFYSSLVAWGFALFPSMIGEILSNEKIKIPMAYLINTYNAIIAGTTNSVVNVYWRGAKWLRTFIKADLVQKEAVFA